MSLIECNECRKEVSNKAESCPHCGARIKEKTGCFAMMFKGFVIVTVIFFIWVSFLPDSPNTTSSILESSALKNIKKDTETQAKRKDLIDDLISQGIFKRIGTPGSIPRIYVGNTFYNLSFKDKEKFVGVVLAYGYSQSKETTMVLIYDNKTNKKVGSYDAVNGLDLN